jgi:hypothetical protein
MEFVSWLPDPRCAPYRHRAKMRSINGLIFFPYKVYSFSTIWPVTCGTGVRGVTHALDCIGGSVYFKRGGVRSISWNRRREYGGSANDRPDRRFSHK